MIKLTSKNYDQVIKSSRRVWPKYATQLMNIANQNCKGTSPSNVGSIKETWLEMKSQSIKGTLENWTNYYNNKFGEQLLEAAGKKIYNMLINMNISWITEEMCIDYAKEIVYNKTHMGMGGEEMALEVVANYFGKPLRYSTAGEESQGIDGWIGDKPTQVKKHEGVFKGHVHNHADTNSVLLVTYEEDKNVCYIHNPEFMSK